LELDTLKMKARDKLSETLTYINYKINKGQERSVKAKKNILAAFLIKVEVLL
jgi:hypothetical protein